MYGDPSLGNDEFTTGPDEDLRARIKAELRPGERLIWMGQSGARPARSNWAYAIAYPLAAILFLAGLILLAARLPISILAIMGGIILALVHAGNRFQRSLQDGAFYALTEHRAILWMPTPFGSALEVHSLERGQVRKIHRLEHRDGTGDVILTCPEDLAVPASPPQRIPARLGFKNIDEVRRVEELVRQTLLVPNPPETVPED